ncbi:MAG: hypothetical protein AVDCRST_MAG66-2665, partial [uncultured Pseudonocardia sp.]
ESSEDRHVGGARGAHVRLLVGRQGQLPGGPGAGRPDPRVHPDHQHDGAGEPGVRGPGRPVPGSRGGHPPVPRHRHRHPHGAQRPPDRPGRRPDEPCAVRRQRPDRAGPLPGVDDGHPAGPHGLRAGRLPRAGGPAGPPGAAGDARPGRTRGAAARRPAHVLRPGRGRRPVPRGPPAGGRPAVGQLRRAHPPHRGLRSRGHAGRAGRGQAGGHDDPAPVPRAGDPVPGRSGAGRPGRGARTDLAARSCRVRRRRPPLRLLLGGGRPQAL